MVGWVVQCMHATQPRGYIQRPQSMVFLVVRIPCLIETNRTKACEREGKRGRVIEKRRQSLKRCMTADARAGRGADIADAVLASHGQDESVWSKLAQPEKRIARAVIQELSRPTKRFREDGLAMKHATREGKRVIAFEMLTLEREKTDRYLLTERARSDDALANRDDFLGMVTHDLRDMLGGIVLSAEVMTRIAGVNEEGKKILAETQRVQRYAARMNRLIGDLVDVASIEAGKFVVKAMPGDFNSLLDEVADTFQSAGRQGHS